MAGIHVHHHDLVDEGPEAIAPWLERIDDLTEVFVQVNDIYERNPSPVGVLERNPRRDVVLGQGRLLADVPASDLSPRLWQECGSETSEAGDALALVASSPIGERYRIVPWLNIANGQWEGAVDENGVVDLNGRVVPRWLCPNGADVAPMWIAVIDAIVRRYGYTTYLIDRIRFPDWGGETVDPMNLLSCFCASCRGWMVEEGLDEAEVRAALTELVAAAREERFDDVVAAFATPVVERWIAFRQQSVTRLVRTIVDGVRAQHPEVELWLDMWPPAYSWILGQDYRALTAISPKLKHFPYHRLGGGADVQSLIDALGATPESRERAFRAFARLFGVDYGLSYERFRAGGFPISLVADQNARVRELSAPGTYIYSGVQMWNLPPEELFEAAVASYASDADDVIYYCYGWAASELIGASNGAREAAAERKSC